MGDLHKRYAALHKTDAILEKRISPAEKEYGKIGWPVIILEYAGRTERDWELWAQQSIEFVFNLLILHKTRAVTEAHAAEWREQQSKRK